jgi:hypothetical protein
MARQLVEKNVPLLSASQVRPGDLLYGTCDGLADESSPSVSFADFTAPDSGSITRGVISTVSTFSVERRPVC